MSPGQLSFLLSSRVSFFQVGSFWVSWVEFSLKPNDKDHNTGIVYRFKQFDLDIILLQVVVLLLVLGLCSVEGMRKRKRNRNQQQGVEVGQFIYWSF